MVLLLFLSNRSQQVKFNSSLSDLAVSSTGAPQGCVSSPFLFTLYTNDCVSSEPNQFIVTFSDDTVILSLLTKNTNLSVHRTAVDKFVNWCDAHLLHINTTKSVEMLLDTRSVGDQSSVAIHGQDIKQVKTFKYLGVYVDSDLSWRTQVANVCARIHQRLHFLRRLRVFGVCKNIMLIFYRATIESVLRYGITSWFGNLTVKSRAEISSLVRTAGKIMGIMLPLNPQDLFEQATIRQANAILSDSAHVLNCEYTRGVKNIDFESIHRSNSRRYDVSIRPHKYRFVLKKKKKKKKKKKNLWSIQILSICSWT